ncbi:hypothetical protein [Citrobacter freundii]|uniref:hypothetical protein n=1 Tax=Citrobacter freundii TaxID=546 RepID=UPI00383B6EBC
MKEITGRKKRIQARLFTERLCIVLITCGCALLIAGGISTWFWQTMFGAIYGEHTGDTGTAGMATDPSIIAEYAALKPLINLVMYIIPWTFYASGCGALVMGFIGLLLEIVSDAVCRVFGKRRGKQNVSR